jgi:hypothetical protein
LQQGIDEGEPIMDRTIYGYQDYDIVSVPERWQQLEIVHKPARGAGR